MKKVWKFPLSTADYQAIKMPKGARVLSAQAQFDRLYAWAVVDDTATSQESMQFSIVGTGHDLGDINAVDWRFLSTIQMADGVLVLHVFVKDV